MTVRAVPAGAIGVGGTDYRPSALLEVQLSNSRVPGVANRCVYTLWSVWPSSLGELVSLWRMWDRRRPNAKLSEVEEVLNQVRVPRESTRTLPLTEVQTRAAAINYEAAPENPAGEPAQMQPGL